MLVISRVDSDIVMRIQAAKIPYRSFARRLVDYFPKFKPRFKRIKMSDNLALAFQLLLTGMVTVFLILGMVVLLGRLLIYIINRYSPDSLPDRQDDEIIARKKLAVLSSVVEVITNGKGVIQSVKKLD